MVLREWARDVRAPVGDVRAALRRLAADPAVLTDVEWMTLLGASDSELDELCALADAARREVVDPDALTFVVNRNLDTTVVGGSVVGGPPEGPGRDGRGLGARGDIGLEDLVAEAWRWGATEICMQGPMPADASPGAELRLVERITAAAPDIHLHAFRPPEIRAAAARMGITIEDFLHRARAAGLGSVPGTAAQVLDDAVRALLTGGAAAPVHEWVEVIETAHRVGLFSTATLLYGHVETPAQQVAHLRLLNDIQDRTGGFSELILMPASPGQFGPHLGPPPTTGEAQAATQRESRAVHAVARLITRGRFDHLQVAWTKLDRDTVESILWGGADDIGGLLLDGELMPEAGQEAGRVLDVADVAALAARVGRVPRQRTTAHTDPPRGRRLRIPQVST